MEVEVNKNTLADVGIFAQKGAPMVLYITPDIDEDYWLARVHVGKNQYVNLFPKMGIFGIGLAHEKEWNVNLPACMELDDIFNHIKDNSAVPYIRKAKIREAIQMLRVFIHPHWTGRPYTP